MKIILLSILSSFILFTHAYGCPSCSGDEIEVTGVIKLEVFPGPPNYENIAEGDIPENYWFAVFDKSVCFSPDNEFLSEEVALTKIQLMFDGSDNQLEEGKKYFIKGITVPAHTGHHHSDVLLQVKSIEKL
jgi:hypothetical protein